MSEPTAERTAVLKNLLGLHMRPAQGFMERAQSFACEVSVTCGEQTINGKSIMGLVQLAAECGQTLRIGCTGEGAREAADALAEFVEQMPETFDEQCVEP